MLDRLLESESARTRSGAGAVVSVAAHTAIIAIAVYATAQAHVAPSTAAETVRPLYFPRRADVSSSPSRPVTARPTIASPPIRMVLPTVPPVSVAAPALDLTGVLSQQRDFPSGLQAGRDTQRGGASAFDSAGTVLSADQVEKQVLVAPGNAAPHYPEPLRNAGIEGRVTAIFVVDEMGRAEDSTVRFVSSENRLFDEAVRAALRRMRFIAAEVGGRKVRQLVQMPFVFTISK